MRCLLLISVVAAVLLASANGAAEKRGKPKLDPRALKSLLGGILNSQPKHHAKLSKLHEDPDPGHQPHRLVKRAAAKTPTCSLDDVKGVSAFYLPGTTKEELWPIHSAEACEAKCPKDDAVCKSFLYIYSPGSVVGCVLFNCQWTYQTFLG